MGWADTVKSKALTALAERTTPTGRVSTGALWTWNPYDVWLSRVRPTGESAVSPSAGDSTTPRRRDTAARD
jgi:hypothetical protein